MLTKNGEIDQHFALLLNLYDNYLFFSSEYDCLAKGYIFDRSILSAIPYQILSPITNNEYTKCINGKLSIPFSKEIINENNIYSQVCAKLQKTLEKYIKEPQYRKSIRRYKLNDILAFYLKWCKIPALKKSTKSQKNILIILMKHHKNFNPIKNDYYDNLPKKQVDKLLSSYNNIKSFCAKINYTKPIYIKQI
ncbi:hypothetical protein CAXC1_150032 [Candidatus Xenohaliotis californiensis]|uniref:Uncharacterized protein n=1 Tax=Candidatus Xenohaliotis californiensis TaxID=84677 RepID=A0ABM9N767_9RICK|nr:hypothetical protein CAXC1_150032 [Candidatus Xenohaliotis californiensis]